MARYESEGYCPCNSFMNPMLLPFEVTDEVVEMADYAWEHLRGVIPAMVYKKFRVNHSGAYVTELLLTQGKFGVEIIVTLENMVKVNDSTKVVLEDVINPDLVTGDIVKENENFKVGLTKTSDCTAEMIISKK